MLETLSDDDYVNVVYVSKFQPSIQWMLGYLFLREKANDACKLTV